MTNQKSEKIDSPISKPQMKIDERPIVAIQRNPRSGSGRGRGQLLALVRSLRDRNFQVRLFKSRDRLDAWVRQPHVEHRLRCLVAAGGDGTLTDMLNRHPNATLMPFPMGTENLMARYVGIPRCGKTAAEIIVGNQSMAFDTATANGHRFLLMLSIGVDAEVVHQLHSRRSGNIGHLSYVRPIVESFLHYRGRMVAAAAADPAEPFVNNAVTSNISAERITSNSSQGTEEHSVRGFTGEHFTGAHFTGEHFTGEHFTGERFIGGHLIVSNVAAYGFGFAFAPEADPHDGLLDIRLFRKTSRISMLFHGLSLWMRCPWKELGVRRFLAKAVRIHSPEASVDGPATADGVHDSLPIQCDGDPCGRLQFAGSPVRVGAANVLSITCLRASLKMMIPKEYMQRARIRIESRDTLLRQ